MTRETNYTQTSQMDGPVHCIMCNTTFSSQACLREHFPCPNSSFDINKVKTEADDSEQDVETSQISSQVNVKSDVCNIKAEVKSEPIDEVTDSDIAMLKRTYSKVGSINKEYRIVPYRRGRGRRGIMHESRGRGGQRGSGRRSLQQVSKTQSIAPKTLQVPSVSFHVVSFADTTQMGQSTLPNILPKVTGSSKISEGAGLKIDSVFYTQSYRNKKNVIKVASTTQANAIFSVGSRTAVCSSGTAGEKATSTVSSTYTLNSGAKLSSLTGQNMNTLNMTPFILGNTILQNAPQDPLILRGSGPLVNPGQSVNTLQTSSLVPGLQAINLSQPLSNLQNLSIPLNQNTALGVQQNIPQVFNAGAQNSSVYTSNTSQAVGSIMASAASPSQQMSYTVPVHMGNQIVLMDLPVQYLPGMPITNVPTTMSLSSLIPSPNPFSLTVTPATVTQHSAVSTISPSQPCNSVSVTSIYPQSALATTQSTIVPRQHCPQPLIANINSAQEGKAYLKSPPLILVVSSSSPVQTQNGSKICSTNLKEKMYSVAATNSPTFELSMTHNEHNQISGTQTIEQDNSPSTVTVHSLHNHELSSGSSESNADSGEKSDSRVNQQVSETLKLKCVIPNSNPITVKSEITQAVVTSSVHQSVMSTSVNSGNLVSAGLPLLNAPRINTPYILPQLSVGSVLKQPFLPHFQTNENIQHGPISVFNNNTVNIGNTSGLFFQNGLNMQRINFPVQKHSGQNVWIQNITDSQAVDIGCNNSQQQIFLNSPVQEALVNNQMMSHVSGTPSNTKKSDVPLHESPSSGELLKKNIRSIKLATPETVRQSLLPSEDRRNNIYAIDAVEETVYLGFAESQREPKTVREMLQTKIGNISVSNDTNSSATTSSTPCSVTIDQSMPVLREYIKIRPNDGRHSLQLLANQFDTKTGLLKKNQILSQSDNNFTNAFVNDSDVSQSNDDVICKITEVKSIADLSPKPVFDHSEFLNTNKINYGSCTKGNLLVGPLTKEQLDKIIQNPSELEKFVSVPSGHVLSSKALVVPAVSNSAIMKTLQSKVTPHETTDKSYVPLQTCLSKQEPSFIKIHPKTLVQTVQTPSHSVTSNTSSSTVTSFPQTNVSIHCNTLSNAPNKPAGNFITTVVTSTGKTETAFNIVTGKFQKEQSNRSTSNTSSNWSLGKRRRRRKFLSEQRRQELICNKNKGSPNNNIMKLSFIGDLKLLKDALRRTTVTLECLDKNCSVTAHGHIKSNQKHLETDLSKDANHKQKLGKRKMFKYEQQEAALKGNKEIRIGKNIQKEWVPLKIVEDLSVSDRLLECQVMSQKTSGNDRKRSSRISAKPRLDHSYAGLEALHLKNLDADIGEPHCNFETVSTAQSPSPPVLSPAVEQVHPKNMVFHFNSLQLSLQNTDLEVIDVDADDSDVPIQTSQGIANTGCISPVKNLKDYYYSSESESDMFDPDTQSLSKDDKKKMMRKQHNAITMFLVKHADQFQSDDEKNEHYCNICHKYKTNGIFRLSRHLKKHFSGTLKCSQCGFEACHEVNLAEHRKTLHLL